MAKILEYNSKFSWVNTLLNSWPLCLDEDSMKSIFAFAWDKEGPYSPPDGSLFYNGYFMIRIEWPLGIWIHIKPLVNRRFQTGIGWKGNGRFAILFRFQSDESAAAGSSGPNSGQATGWNRGTA